MRLRRAYGSSAYNESTKELRVELRPASVDAHARS